MKPKNPLKEKCYRVGSATGDCPYAGDIRLFSILVLHGRTQTKKGAARRRSGAQAKERFLPVLHKNAIHVLMRRRRSGETREAKADSLLRVGGYFGDQNGRIEGWIFGAAPGREEGHAEGQFLIQGAPPIQRTLAQSMVDAITRAEALHRGRSMNPARMKASGLSYLPSVVSVDDY
ncbi:MAG: hypothetical protein IPN74_18745 [Haliscomenobacter sp.]|nr:hypothetical protein [Haliscomenobacter sp.]